ncbi:hypothetical protein DPMN_176956 [Dreissena polymorpha]|uniref:Uncharacterized protein n=1 Tax=Dreissena polymorpha TaxID=45954 RepID=A0A9D4IHD8_DREPO|nr:hypothetical protein DPMN_176956 [Dreissena polymorpha]
MQQDKQDVKAGDKRPRDNISSVSSVSDTSLCEKTAVKQRKKKQKNVQSDSSNDSNDTDTDMVIAKELKSINEQLSNVLTKDSNHLKDLIKEFVIQLK